VVKKVLERRPTRAITVFVDMKDVDRAAKKVCANNFEGNWIHTLILLYYRKIIYLETRRMKAMTVENLM
jgi:hypothetical protein